MARPAGREKADPRDREVARLKKEVERLQGELDKSRRVVEIQRKLSALLEQLASDSTADERRDQMIEDAISELSPIIGTTAALSATGVDRATWYRKHRQSPAPVRPERVAAPQPRALSVVERKEIKRVLDSDEFVDEAPATVYAKLLDQGTYLASVSTMYRVLHEHDEVRERRRQATHPAHKKPELIAEGPNQIWSWDITKLHGPEKWTYYYLLVTWNQTAGLNDLPFHELRGQMRLVDSLGGEVAGARPSRTSGGVAADLGRSRAGAEDDRRLCPRAC